MAFIRRKLVRGVAYFSIVENRRVRGKVRQKVLYSLGRHATIEEAIARELGSMEFVRKFFTRNLQARAERLAECKARLKDLGRWTVVLQKRNGCGILSTTGEQIEIFDDENA
jgi:hypothetical protein